jgi:hypothetical protein
MQHPAPRSATSPSTSAQVGLGGRSHALPVGREARQIGRPPAAATRLEVRPGRRRKRSHSSYGSDDDLDHQPGKEGATRVRQRALQRARESGTLGSVDGSRSGRKTRKPSLFPPPAGRRPLRPLGIAAFAVGAAGDRLDRVVRDRPRRFDQTAERHGDRWQCHGRQPPAVAVLDQFEL